MAKKKSVTDGGQTDTLLLIYNTDIFFPYTILYLPFAAK